MYGKRVNFGFMVGYYKDRLIQLAISPDGQIYASRSISVHGHLMGDAHSLSFDGQRDRGNLPVEHSFIIVRENGELTPRFSLPFFCHDAMPHCTCDDNVLLVPFHYGPEQPRNLTKVLGHLLDHSLICLYCSFIC